MGGVTLRTIGVVGSGQMGRGIAQVAAQSGFDVLLHDQDATALDKARTFIDSSLKRLVEKGKLPERVRAETLGRIRPVAVPGAFSAADFVIDGPAEHGLPHLVQLFGIESPGLTSALSLAEEVVAKLAEG